MHLWAMGQYGSIRRGSAAWLYTSTLKRHSWLIVVNTWWLLWLLHASGWAMWCH